MIFVCLLVDCTRCSEYFVQLFEAWTWLVCMLACVRLCVASQLSRATLSVSGCSFEARGCEFDPWSWGAATFHTVGPCKKETFVCLATDIKQGDPLEAILVVLGRRALIIGSTEALPILCVRCARWERERERERERYREREREREWDGSDVT